MKILLVEDEPSVAGFLHQGLTEQGYTVDLAADGLLGLHRAQSTPYDCLILDQMLPGLSGLEVCRQVRAQNAGVPILLLTALGETDDKIRGLDAGADDYLVKPFAFSELLARIRALARRRVEAPPSRPCCTWPTCALTPPPSTWSAPASRCSSRPASFRYSNTCCATRAG
jgi:two-component system OmpR family response regulator